MSGTPRPSPTAGAGRPGTRWRRIVLATRNEHKVGELRRILAPVLDELGFELVGAGDLPGAPEVAETAVTFEGNARLKAVALAQATGLPSLADDSGLAVQVLGGSPGVFSARWSGTLGGSLLGQAERDRLNLRLLLDQLADVPDGHRGAAFVCAAALAMPGGEVVVTHGRIEGTLAREPSGGNGFGYDPVFVPRGAVRTLAQYTDAEKNAVSHRGQAFRAMSAHLRRLLDRTA